MRKVRAFLLIMVLLLGLLLVTMGLGLLGSRVNQYRSTTQAVLAAEARQLARAGLEDARTKLNRDIRFPPTAGAGQTSFSYSEDYLDCNNNPRGSYQIELDYRYTAPPHSVLAISSTGLVGPRANPSASHTYRIYLDLLVGSATYFQVIRWEDLGTP